MGGAEVNKESQSYSFENSGKEMEDSDFEVAERKVCVSVSKSFLILCLKIPL